MEIVFTVFEESWQPGTFSGASSDITSLWIKSGNTACNGQSIPQGTGIYLSSDDSFAINTATRGLRFVIAQHPSHTTAPATHPVCVESTEVLSERIEFVPGEVILRLDQVDFPPEAIAYRHTHPGPGIRYLTQGALTIQSDHGVEHFTANQAWFEAANSPVVATAVDATHSSFVRIMLLPIEYEGKSTFTLQNKEDAHKPRLQTNTRFFDKRLNLSP